MHPSFILVGRLAREYILPAQGQPISDSPGGDLLYTAGGLAVWDNRLGLVGRLGEDAPRFWLDDWQRRGFDVSGIRIQPGELDLRSFLAYSENFEVSNGNPVSHYARRGVPFPKPLLGFQPREETRSPRLKLDPAAPSLGDLPRDYLDAGALHLCPLDLGMHLTFLESLRTAMRIITLDPSPSYMIPSSMREVRSVLNGLTAFLPSKEEIAALFWGQTHDVWEMCEAIGEYGCEYVAIKCGADGQLLYDSGNKRRYEIPAYPVRMTDPTGAGDAFCGGFLAGYRKDYDPLEGVLYGNVSASLTVEGSGPFSPLECMPGLAQARLDSLRDLVRRV
jgi:ribokinase